MERVLDLVIDLAVVVAFLVGFALFRRPRGARAGNLVAAAAFTAAVVLVIVRGGIGSWGLVLAVLAAGSATGWFVAARVSMLQIPAMVAFQHGAGGVAAFLVSLVELWRDTPGGWSVPRVSALLGIVIGAGTFAGSLIAAGKLTGRLRGTPRVLPGHGLVLLGLVAAIAVIALLVGGGGPGAALVGGAALVLPATALGVLVGLRVGGADMPVLISFLNATAGLAAAFCGVVTGSRLLVAAGAVVAASGSILTHVMCRAMNRGLWNVFAGGGAQAPSAAWLPVTPSAPNGATDAPPPSSRGESAPPPAVPGAEGPAPAAAPEPPPDPLVATLAAARAAKRIVIVPGYGMAVAQAQFDVVGFAAALAAQGAEVKYAIHPVAGRMPGHMNVLLAEADASYEDLLELDDGNERLAGADLAIVVGASDVVNPAAVDTPGTPISGMPILRVQDARSVVVCNLDARPGYSGVPNTLYDRPGVIKLFGDAKETFARLCEAVGGRPAA
jgi:NAD(P) transhydrogenase subunit beta